MSVSIVPTLDMERAIAASGYDVIVGFDEVGRGSLAGPVMVGAAAIRTCDLSGPSPLASTRRCGRFQNADGTPSRSHIRRA